MTLLQDLRFALRSLRAHAASSMFATLTLACGLAAAISIYCVVDAILLRALPYPDAARIVQLREVADDGHEMALARPNYDDIASGDGNRDGLFDAIALHTSFAATIAAGSDVVRRDIGYAGGDFFRVFAIAPQAGRVFDRDEHGRVAVISDALWRGLLQARGDAVGSAIDVAGDRYTIIGVMPPAFAFPASTALWIPVENGAPETSRSAHNWQAVARLAAGQSIAPARLALHALAQRLKQQYGTAIDAVEFSVTPLAAALAAPVRKALLLLALGTAFLLLIAVTNTTNVLLAATAARARELAVRAALGASAARLARQILFECLLIAAAACVLALVAARLAVAALLHQGAAYLPRIGEVALDARAIAIGIAMTAAIAIVVTLAVVANLRRRPVVDSLRESGRGQSPGRGQLRTRIALLVAQTALTTTLLIGAGLLARSFIALLGVDPGFVTAGALSVQLSQPTGSVAAATRTAQRYRQLIDAFAALPGVAAVGGINALPLSADGADGGFWDGSVTAIREPMPKPIGYGEFRVASAGYFAAAGIPLRAGRAFDARDRADSAPVAIVSASLARATWGDRDPLGQRVQSGNMDGQTEVATVIGVVGDVREHRLDKAPRGSLYVNLEQRPLAAADFNIVVRAGAAAEALAASVRGVLDARAADIPHSMRKLDDLRADVLAERRFSLVLLGAFAVVAFVLAIGGLYGLMAFAVGQRAHEFALRQALGATRTRIARLVLGSALGVGVGGIAAGIGIALIAAHVARAFLFGIAPSDLVTIAAVSAVLLATIVAAGALPTWRACATAPREVLA